MRRLFLVALAAAVVSVLAVAASPSVAHAAEPCWQRVIDDWTKDGKIDGHYSPRCLRQAIKNTPEDLRDYSSIDDDIQAALLGHFGASAGPNNGGGSGGSGGSGNGNGTQKPLTPAEAQQKAELAVPKAGTAQSIPDTSRPLPLPLLILAAVALAAVLAAASPPLIHRIRARFPRTRAAPQPDR
jgi:hypothetical protein